MLVQLFILLFFKLPALLVRKSDDNPVILVSKGGSEKAFIITQELLGWSMKCCLFLFPNLLHSYLISLIAKPCGNYISDRASCPTLKKNRQTTVSMVSDTAAHPLKAVLLLVAEIWALRMCERLKVRLFVSGLFFHFHLVLTMCWSSPRLLKLKKYLSQTKKDFSMMVSVLFLKQCFLTKFFYAKRIKYIF